MWIFHGQIAKTYTNGDIHREYDDDIIDKMGSLFVASELGKPPIFRQTQRREEKQQRTGGDNHIQDKMVQILFYLVA